MQKLGTRLLRVAVIGLVLAILVVAALSATTSAKTQLRDVNSSWAKDDILTLVNKGIINGYPDGTFRPQRGITRAEFAKIVARAFHLDPQGTPKFKDAKDHWARSHISALTERGIIKGYPDGTFRPDNRINRAEMIAMVIRALNFGEKDGIFTQGWPETFSDIPASHWAFKSVELANRLGLLPPYYGEKLEPETEATRADTAHMIRTALELDRITGTVATVDAQNMSITINTNQNDTATFTLPYDAIIVRNGTLSEVSNLMEGDAVQLINTREGMTRLVQATGVVTKADVTTKVSLLTGRLLTPEQVEALIKGDWKSLGNTMQYALYNQLLTLGATPEEAEAILAKDWKNLSSLGKERLAKAISTELNLPVEIVYALYDRDWNKVQDLARLQLTQAVLGRLLNLN